MAHAHCARTYANTTASIPATSGGHARIYTPHSQNTASKRGSRRGMNSGSRITERRTTILIVGRGMCWIRSFTMIQNSVRLLSRVPLGAEAHPCLYQLYRSHPMGGLSAVSCGCVSIALGLFLQEVCTRHSFVHYLELTNSFLLNDVRNTTGGRERVYYSRTAA